MIMQKIGKNSHFEPVNGRELEELGNRILQVDSDNLYMNRDGFGVYMAEIDDSPGVVEDYKRTRRNRRMNYGEYKTIDDWIKTLKEFKKSAGGDAKVRFIGLIDGKECDDMFLHGMGHSIEQEIYVMLADYPRTNKGSR